MVAENCSIEHRIASLVHAHFDALPRNFKPSVRPNGTREWIPLSGIVLVTGEATNEETLTCVALATGAKCLSYSQLPLAQGSVLHDSHAEVLALRALNRWLLEECKSMLMYRHHPEPISTDSGDLPGQVDNDSDRCGESRFLEWRRPADRDRSKRSSDTNNKSILWPPFKFKDNIRIWMYCTCAPCGDASMELCMAAQEDSTPWDIPVSSATNAPDATPFEKLLDGRAYFSVLGAVRRKPSRADAQKTLSKSCSDKLAAKQVTSVLSILTSLLIISSPNAYIANIILPEEEISRTGCARSFGSGETGRLRTLEGREWREEKLLNGSYTFMPFSVRSLPMPHLNSLWGFFKRTSATEASSRPSNISAVWTASPTVGSISPYTLLNGTVSAKYPNTFPSGVTEALLNGVKRGYAITSTNPRKASLLSRRKMWELFNEILDLSLNRLFDHRPDVEEFSGLGSDLHVHQGFSLVKDYVLSIPAYLEMKRNTARSGLLCARSEALKDTRQVLGNWIENRGDDDWNLY